MVERWNNVSQEFKDLRRKRDKLRGLPDQLNYAIPIDDYTIALKDGAFLSAFDCSGQDLNSASVEELDAHRALGNRALARLDDGFQYNIDLFRYPSLEYSSRTFPDPVSAALDREREIQYFAEGQHFETRCVLKITYRPPADAQTRIAGVFLSGAPKHTHWRRHSTGSSRNSASLRMRSVRCGSWPRLICLPCFPIWQAA
jgi:type IV secretion system protein VirB4